MNAPRYTRAEEVFCETIRLKDESLRSYLNGNSLTNPTDAAQWLQYLTGIRITLGNLNNDIGFVATLLVKTYLEHRFGVKDFDAAGKPQGASGVDIEARTADGDTIVGEIKTTKPYQPGFGAAQRASIIKDLKRLAESKANHRFMFVIDSDTYAMLSGRSFVSLAPGVETVNLVTGESFVCP